MSAEMFVNRLNPTVDWRYNFFIYPNVKYGWPAGFNDILHQFPGQRIILVNFDTSGAKSFSDLGKINPLEFGWDAIRDRGLE